MIRSLLPALVLLATTLHAENWNQFRGPRLDGALVAPGLPAQWDASKILWKATLKGSGQSSPAQWEDKLFLTGGSVDGKQRFMMCLSSKDGATLWEDTIACATPEAIHDMNSYATPSCATDGKIVVAYFGPGGLHGWDLDGKKLWSLDLGVGGGTWGFAASPVIVDGKVIQNCDSEGPSRLVAVDATTGKIAWETPRETKPKGGWSTPTLIEHEGRRELVLNGEFGVQAYDPVTGKELWFCEAPTGRGEPVPVYAHGKLYVVCGKPGDAYAVKPGGSGKVTATHRLWLAPRKGGRDIPTPVVVGDTLFISSMSGVASAYDAESGATLFTERLGEGIEIAAAPLVANGLAYFQTVNGGDVIVVKPGKTLEIVSRNSLGDAAKGETFRAVPVPMGDRVLLRGGSSLYCVGK
jgi:outer membrane protein assembly factor BamB